MTIEIPDLEQTDIEHWFRTSHGTERWTVLYQSAIGAETGIALYSCLLRPESISDSLRTFNWDLQVGSGGPGFSQEYRGGEPITRYHRIGEIGGEALVHVRSFPQGRERYIETSEELRLLFNLYEDRDSRSFFEQQSDGVEIEVIRTTSSRVEIRTSLLRRYLAARQRALALLIDSAIWIPSQTHSILPKPREIRSKDCALTFHSGSTSSRVFSTLLGKKILIPADRAEMDLWPYERPEDFLDFIIGEDESGRVIEHTSDPEQLANYFGKNAGAPHYLTPVYFDPEVLRRYYENGDKYSVEDGVICQGGLWTLRVDNNHSDHVMVFLGDLGRDIPQSERRHWRTYNLPVEERNLSETAFRRSILGEFADAESPEHQFKYRYQEAGEAWLKTFAWPLFLPLHPQDKHVLSSLRRPLSETNDEFDSQVLDLAKLIVDSINEAQLVANTKAPSNQGDKGIAKLERFLRESSYTHVERDMALLRSIQGLRSKGAAHRKGSDYDLSLAGLNADNLNESFVALLKQSAQMLGDLTTFVNYRGESLVDDDDTA